MVLEGASEVFYRVSLSDGAGRVEFVSPQCERLTGHAPEDFTSNPEQWTELLHPEDAPRVAERTDAILSAASEGTRYYRIRNRDGRYRNVEDRIVPLTDDDGVLLGYQGVARDVTERVREVEERRELDLRLRQAERMEALGRMAGGVAHDFNNILTVILACCETALSEMEPDGPATRDIEEVAKAGRRAANLTRQLLGFSRKQVTAPRVVDLSSHLTTLESLLRRTVTERVNLDFSLGKDLWRAYVDPAQVDQIVINLVANARDALGGSGSISISTDNIVLDADFCAAHRGSTPGDYVMLSVHDDGSGMDEAALKNAFLPFFTTKPEGRGTGIGLSSVYGIVKQNRGYVRLDSEVGWGTTVEVYLPRYQGDVREKIATPRSPTSLEGHETVLLVEDDTEVRRATRKLLERLGFDVLEAETPFLAIEVCESHTERIDLLLTDVVMPGMNGAELAATIRALKPGIATLFMSGYAERLAGDIGIPRDGFHYLEKPFDQEALAEAMQKALAKR